jgi:hypothetical protein
VTSHSSALAGADPAAEPAGSGVDAAEPALEPDPDLGGDVWRPHAIARQRIEQRIDAMRSMPQRTAAGTGSLPVTGGPGGPGGPGGTSGAVGYGPSYSLISSVPEAKLPHVALYFSA